MKWIGISGGWRKINQQIEAKVRTTVSKIIQEGNGIVSGGALNVDYVALDEALKHDPKANKIKIFLPTMLPKFIEHFRKHANLGTITNAQAEQLIFQLTNLQKLNPKAVIENLDTNFTEDNKKRKYYERNSRVVDASDELVAFRIRTNSSEGEGTADTITKAHAKGISVKVYEYNLKS